MMKLRILPVLLGGAAMVVPSVAMARKSPLAGQPAVRHKQELRLQRIEVAPTFEATVQADYKHTVSGGVKVEYHLSDALSVGGMLFFGGAIDTKLTEQIRDSLPDNEIMEEPRTPDKGDFDSHLNTIPFHGGVGVTFTPWFGKMALFGKAFVNFDVYVSGGFGFAQTSNDNGGNGGDTCSTPADKDPRNDCPHNAGFNPGIQMAAGMHIYFNKWVALDFYFRNYMFSDNPSGGDFDADLDVDGDDRRFLSHLFFGVGVSMFLPPKAKISR